MSLDPAQMMIAPAPPPVSFHDLPPQISRSRATECIGELLGSGSRMEVYPLVDEHTVIRVPRRTEQQLIEEHGSSGRKVMAAGYEVSTVTEKELQDLRSIESFIGAFIPDTTPLADLDLAGNFRYYSIQRRLHPILDLRDNVECLEATHSRRSLERFIRDIRDMHQALNLLPDFAGKGNLVLDSDGLVKLVDINNVRRLVSNEELDAAMPQDLGEFLLGFRDIHRVLPPGFTDDLGMPVGDLTLARLQQLEIRALGRDVTTVENDPFYEPLYHERRRVILAILRGDMA
ncbi:MAG: hypothetical protein KAI47_11920 [Deltaproteobacteria bacterium]|nr:hypothetical protein [Deltaproteobacteria bacterium]